MNCVIGIRLNAIGGKTIQIRFIASLFFPTFRSWTDIFGVSVGCVAATDFSSMVVSLFPHVHHSGIGFAG